MVDWETAFRTFEVATSKDLAIRIDTRGKSRAELLAIEDQARKNFEAASALFQSLPSTGMPAFWKDHACKLSQHCESKVDGQLWLTTFRLNVHRPADRFTDIRVGYTASITAKCLEVSSLSVECVG